MPAPESFPSELYKFQLSIEEWFKDPEFNQIYYGAYNEILQVIENKVIKEGDREKVIVTTSVIGIITNIILVIFVDKQ